LSEITYGDVIAWTCEPGANEDDTGGFCITNVHTDESASVSVYVHGEQVIGVLVWENEKVVSHWGLIPAWYAH
jgi:hypothetical protein